MSELADAIRDIRDGMPENPDKAWLLGRLKHLGERADRLVKAAEERATVAIREAEKAAKAAQATATAAKKEAEEARASLSTAQGQLGQMQSRELFRELKLTGEDGGVDDTEVSTFRVIYDARTEEHKELSFEDWMRGPARDNPLLSRRFPHVDDGGDDTETGTETQPEPRRGGAPPRRAPSRAPERGKKPTMDQVRKTHAELVRAGKMEEARAYLDEHKR